MDNVEYELDILLHTANGMVLQTKQGEDKINDMLSRANRVTERISTMCKYEKMLDDVKDLTVNGNRRKLILNDLQRENRQIMALQDENRQLRECTEDYLAAIRDILTSHNEIKNSIRIQQENKSVDEIDNILFEMSNHSLEGKLKSGAQKIHSMMNMMEKKKREDDQKLALAVQRNKNYKEIFKLACFSNPAAANILKSTMKSIYDEIGDDSTKTDSQNDDNANETVLNQTIVRNKHM